ncbi:lytic transglycosylase domain-containing protein [Altererythrobacter aquiaggeris]|uniref:lytic transglycosylase domain-containing protein n=1 Tax=Aestuarierythrobacter aquiaggeris TaxID=1898396 RepID=UPI00301620E6
MFTRVTIRQQILVATALAAPFCLPGVAIADVLEIDDGAYSWIAGGPVSPLSGALETTTGEPNLTFFAEGEMPVVPDHAVAYPQVAAANLPAAYSAKVHELSARFDLSPSLIEALVWQESRWRANAVSPVGARGLAQLMPGTARELGVNPDDPFANLEGGARYLRQQIDRFDGDLERALAAYNAGPGRVIRAGGVPEIRETKNYVAAIMGRLSDHSRR